MALAGLSFLEILMPVQHQGVNESPLLSACSGFLDLATGASQHLPFSLCKGRTLNRGLSGCNPKVLVADRCESAVQHRTVAASKGFPLLHGKSDWVASITKRT